MITADKTMIIETTNVIPINRAGNSGTVGVGDAVGTVVGFAVGTGVGVAVGTAVGAAVGTAVGAAVGTGVGVGVGAGFTVTETVLDAGEVTGVEALSVTVQVTVCEVPAAV